MKSYTDLEQSEKLAEILPFTTADMIWYGIYCGMDGKYHYDENNELDVIAINEETCKKLFRLGDEYVNWLPCWSLSALLNIINKNFYPNIFHDGEAWNIEVTHHDNNAIKYDTHSNDIIDGVFEIILKLYESKTL